MYCSARLAIYHGADRAIRRLLESEIHFAEGNALWITLIRELDIEPTSDFAYENLGSQFRSLVTVLLTDLELKFLAGTFEESWGQTYSNVEEASYVESLQLLAGTTYTKEKLRASMSSLETGKGTFHKCILILHSIVALLVPDMKALSDAGQARAPASQEFDISLEITHDEIAFATPAILANIRRHRGDALKLFSLKPNQASHANLLKKVSAARKAFLMADGLERVLSVLDFAVKKFEGGEWCITNLFNNQEKMNFFRFLPAEMSMQISEENTSISELIGCVMLIFTCGLSRASPSASEDKDMAATSKKASVAYSRLAHSLFRLERVTFPLIESGQGKLSSRVIKFLLHFFFSMAIGTYSPLIEHIISFKSNGDAGDREFPNIGQLELQNPRALILPLEILAEFPVSLEPFELVLPLLFIILKFIRRLAKNERNLEIALDAGIVKSLLWTVTRPIAANEEAERAIIGTLAVTAKRHVGAEDLRTWLNLVIADYSFEPVKAITKGETGGNSVQMFMILNPMCHFINPPKYFMFPI